MLIVGELKDKAKIPCFHNGAGDVRKDNFMDFYGTVDYENALPALIFSSDYLAKTSSVWQTVSNYAIIVYPDDYPAESLKAEQQKLGRLGCRQFISLRDMDKNSRQYLFKDRFAKYQKKSRDEHYLHCSACGGISDYSRYGIGNVGAIPHL
ncbi:MAG: hypothetical protein ACI4J8_11190 [Oscillospiraceae bacterium]